MDLEIWDKQGSKKKGKVQFSKYADTGQGEKNKKNTGECDLVKD